MVVADSFRISEALAGLLIKELIARGDLKRCLTLARLQKVVGQRARKHLPAADVAAAGGWSDLTTLLSCYQQVDEATLLSVMNEPRKVMERARSG